MSIHRLCVAASMAMLMGASLSAQQGGGAAASRAATSARSDSVASEITFRREVFTYTASGRRDPFASLIATGDIRPIFSDLLVAGIVYDPSGRNSVAMLQDISTGELYRARVGSVFGRLRVTAIREKDLSVAIDEFGFTRQETLSLNSPAPGERTP